MKVPYERVVQWAAGPVSAGIGLLSTAVMHQTVSKSTATDVATFVLSSGATYLAHHKWLDNAAKWWNSEARKSPLIGEAEGLLLKAGTAVAPDVETDITRAFQEITASSAAAQKVQETPGTPAEEVKQGQGLSANPDAAQATVSPAG